MGDFLGSLVCSRRSSCNCCGFPLGMRQTISVEVVINYLKKWCIKPEAEHQDQRPPEEESEGAEFASTVQHIHNVYNYLHTHCPPGSLKELFQHTPAVFIEYNRSVAAALTSSS